MKTLRLLLAQTMFWLNISNDVFNIKMRNSYLSFVRSCARAFVSWVFFSAVCAAAVATATTTTSLCVCVCVVCTSCVWRINLNDATKIIIIIRTAAIITVYGPSVLRVYFFRCCHAHSKKTEHTIHKHTHRYICILNTKIIKIIKPTIKHTLRACWTEIIFYTKVVYDFP